MDLAEGCVLQYPLEKCPANYINLVGSRVEVLTINHIKFVGQIYSMDPISGRLVDTTCLKQLGAHEAIVLTFLLNSLFPVFL